MEYIGLVTAQRFVTCSDAAESAFFLACPDSRERVGSMFGFASEASTCRSSPT